MSWNLKAKIQYIFCLTVTGGGEDMDDNGVAVLIEDGEVTEVGYKDIAF